MFVKQIFGALFAAALAATVSAPALADSPLTSTDLIAGYGSLPELKETAGGVLTPELASKLTGDILNRGEKVAIVNALGWVFEGKQNAAIFRDALVSKYGPTVVQEGRVHVSDLTTDELVVLGYLVALDNYFLPSESVGYLEAAALREPRSLAVAVVRGLVRAQLSGDLGLSGCSIWQAVAAPLTRPQRFETDLALVSLRQPKSYMELYRENCKGQKD